MRPPEAGTPRKLSVRPLDVGLRIYVSMYLVSELRELRGLPPNLPQAPARASQLWASSDSAFTGVRERIPCLIFPVEQLPRRIDNV